MFNDIKPAALEELKKLIGERYVSNDPDTILPYSHDEFSLKEIAHLPEVVVKPSPNEPTAVLPSPFGRGGEHARKACDAGEGLPA